MVNVLYAGTWTNALPDRPDSPSPFFEELPDFNQPESRACSQAPPPSPAPPSRPTSREITHKGTYTIYTYTSTLYTLTHTHTRAYLFLF